MKAAKIQNWTLVHAFYADSGGFVFGTADFKAFPVTARQIHYLVTNHYIDPPPISKKEIFDKSKADLFAKFFAALQSGWFILQVVARATQHLPITLLELGTLTLIICTATTLFFWVHKPLNVETPSLIESSITMEKILLQAGSVAEKPYVYTPLDFADDLDYISFVLPLHNWWRVQERPLPRLPNDRDSRLNNFNEVLFLTVPTAAFATLQLIAWNFSFPTGVEKLLYRYTTVGNCSILGFYCLAEAAAIVASDYRRAGLHTYGNYKLRWPYSLMFIVPAALYLGARIIVITEVIITLRALPAGAFECVDWAGFFPHV
ncbi:MAG: hypothetical protein Q9165_001926 [Trypethelium subeluteriae]